MLALELKNNGGERSERDLSRIRRVVLRKVKTHRSKSESCTLAIRTAFNSLTLLNNLFASTISLSLGDFDEAAPLRGDSFFAC